jgi:hypothetical protein
VIDKLITSIRQAAVYDRNTQVAPTCILWTDKDCQWEKNITILQQYMSELLVLGEFKPEIRTGTAVWLRCVLAGKIDNILVDKRNTPVIYLPGISRQDLRAVDNCPENLKPLAELQYRGTIWSQTNGKDYTILAFFMNKQGGLGLQVAQDSETIETLQSIMPRLLSEESDSLKGTYINASYLQSKMIPDLAKMVLRWIAEGQDYQKLLPEEEWRAFLKLSQTKLSFNPLNDGQISAAGKLMQREGEWAQVWTRFEEAYMHYESIFPALRKVVPMITDDPSIFPAGNTQAEKNLNASLKKLASLPNIEARKLIHELEKDNAKRRQGVWAKLGEAPLANAIKYLDRLATLTTSPVGGNISDMARYYLKAAWEADLSAIQALSAVDQIEHQKAIESAIAAIYLPWLDESAKNLQQAVRSEGYPQSVDVSELTTSGSCRLFVDGLRTDIGHLLVEKLSSQGLKVKLNPYWAALPSVTATGKPAVMPIRNQLVGEKYVSEFLPQVKSGGQQATSDKLNHLLNLKDWQNLDQANPGNGSGLGWYEAGDIDSTGHNSGINMAKQIPAIIDQLAQHIMRLLLSGWKSISIVTDHGWLLMPGGLPKAHLPSVLTESKWGRCASIKEGAVFDGNQYPWYWNALYQIAIPEGVHCYKNGMEYAHGGLSLQECLLTEIIVSSDGKPAEEYVSIEDITWKRLRCFVSIEGPTLGLAIDIRTAPANPQTSIVSSVKNIEDKESTSIVVSDPELEGNQAYVVVLKDNEIIVQSLTTIGGEE